MTRRRHADQTSTGAQGRGATGPVSFQIEGPAVTNAFVLHIEFTDPAVRAGGSSRGERTGKSRLAEAVQLATAIDLAIVGQTIVSLGRLRPSTLLGAGKVDELAVSAEACKAELVIVNAQLTPVQQRNLEIAWNAKVVDRTSLILEIFGRRARTREGVLHRIVAIGSTNDRSAER